MSQDYLTGQYALQAEQENDFLKRSMELSRSSSDVIRTQDFERYLKLSNSAFFDETLTYYITSDFEVLKLYIAIHVNDCIRTANADGLPTNITENLKKDCFFKITQAKTQQDLSDVTKDLIRELMAQYEKYAIHNYSYTVQRAVEFIHTKRFQQIFPKDVVAALNVERTHLSKQFHRETGMTMTDYIHTTKMDLAESLIRSHTYSLMEVSDMVGYPNYNSFCRVYKKYKHCLPKDTCRRE